MDDKTQELLATIDLGSNSFRLLIAKISKDGVLYPLDQIKETVRLASGLDKNNNLTIKAQENALKVLARFSERLAGFKKNKVRAVATSTLRIAKNSQEFLEKAVKVLKYKIEIISGNEEARLIYIGAAHSLAFTLNKRLVIDIGGGSTEFIIGSGYKPQIMESVTMGCVSFSNRYFKNGNLNLENFNCAIFAARCKIQTMEHLFIKHSWEIAIGTSGTARALYELCLIQGLGQQITLNSLYQIQHLLLEQKNFHNLNVEGIKEERKPVIAGGLAIMIAIMEELAINELTIADWSLREGVMYDLWGRIFNQDLRIHTIKDLKKRYGIDETQSLRVANFAKALYLKLLTNNSNFTSPQIDDDKVKLMHWATELYEIGLSISHNDYHKHGAYILANSDLAGFSKLEQIFLADLVKCHRGGVAKVIDSLKERHIIKPKFMFMVLAFRIAVIFNRRRQNLPNAELLQVTNSYDNGCSLSVNKEWLNSNPLTLHSLKEEIEDWQNLNFKIDILEK
jgi:exopolyphosphatase/guanosine-5'-triphosphate,3'-diphosphate pyrophosphatase